MTSILRDVVRGEDVLTMKPSSRFRAQIQSLDRRLAYLTQILPSAIRGLGIAASAGRSAAPVGGIPS
jgi:hypothetical protein